MHMTKLTIPGDNLLQAAVSDKTTKWIAAIILFSSVGFSLFFSWMSGLFILAAHAIGFFICFIFRNYIIRLGLLLSKPKHAVPVVTPRSHHCSVCGNHQCGRHRPVTRHKQETTLPDKVDNALQLLFEKILEQYIERWHSKVSEDSDFEQELRLSMQNAVSILLHRFNQIEESVLLTERLLPAAIAHFDLLVRNKQTKNDLDSPESPEVWHLASEEFNTNQEDISEKWFLGKNPDTLLPWHPATFSRRHEIAYLRHLTLKLLPSILLPHQLSCRAWGGLVREILARWVLLPAMDLLADGAILLKLLERLLDHTPLLPPYSSLSKPVPTLHRFVSDHETPSPSRLRVSLSNVLKEPQLLYHFMQYLKKVGAVHVLQFCLDLEKFNDRMLEPDLEEIGLAEVYQEAWDLFSLYFSTNSPDCVSFPSEIVNDLKAVLESGEKHVLRLRNTPPLFQAFEYAYAKLEKELLPQFHHSDDYFIMLCGGRLGRFKKKKSPRLRAEDGAGSSWPKGTDSAAYAEVRVDSWDASGDGLREALTHKNLSAWRVSVPRVYLRPEMPGSTRITAVMVIAIQRIDIQEDDDPADCGWTVYRTHSDFCALASKLQEFHGEFQQVECTPLKRPLTRGLEALEAWRVEGEEYLQALLHTPALQNSDLLCAFLSPDIDFAEVIGGSELSLAKMLRTVRLHKENGQYLEPFITNLLTSTKRKSRNTRAKEEDEESPQPPTTAPKKKLSFTHSVFGDNLGLKHANHSKIATQTPVKVSDTSKNWPLQGMFDSIIYIVVRIFGAPGMVVQIAVALRHLFQRVIDSFYQRKLTDKLHRALGPNRIVFLIHMLIDEISGQRVSSSRMTLEVEVETARKVLHHLERLLPWPISQLPHTKSSLNSLIRALRTPLLNKQLAYTLLDILVEELYPELRTESSNG